MYILYTKDGDYTKWLEKKLGDLFYWAYISNEIELMITTNIVFSFIKRSNFITNDKVLDESFSFLHARWCWCLI